MELQPFVRYAARSMHLPNRFLTIAYDCRCLYILRGCGQLVFSDASYPLAPGTLALYPSGIPYMPLPDEQENMEFVSVNFDYTQQYAGNQITMPPLPAEHIHPERIQRTQDDVEPELFRRPLVLPGMQAAEATLLELTEEYRRRDRYFHEVGASLFRTVLYLAARSAEANSRAGRTVDRALQFLREHLAEPIGNEDVARALNFHSYYLNRLVREQTGRSLHQQLLLFRLNHAQRLLLSTELSIEAVATQSGFQSAAHFSTRFRRHFGVSPSAFRRGYGA